MSVALQISTTFLTGEYHGEEWPPSPARLVQALVAGAKTGGNRDDWASVREGLMWLEAQKPPRIRTRHAEKLTRYKLAVPNNDFDVIAKEWAAGRAADPASIKTMKPVNTRAIRAPQLVPHVQYIWRLDETKDASEAQRLVPAVRSLYSLGWGIDMAFADSVIAEETEAEGWVEWIPSAKGIEFSVPVQGFLEDLESSYQRFVARSSGIGVDTDTRPRLYGLQRYEAKGALQAPFATFELRTMDDEAVISKPWQDTMELAAWMRHAAGGHLKEKEFGETLEGYVYGHPQKGEDANRRIAYLSLPSIHAKHGDGRIRRVMVAEPLDANGRASHLLTTAWRGAALTKDGKDQCLLRPFPGDSVTSYYTSSSRNWGTVTPVILHGHNANHGSISLPKTEKLILRALEMAGRQNSEVKSVAFQRAPLWKGTGASGEMTVPKHLEEYPRYHIKVVFAKPVSGPVIAGIGRHYGIGLFAAIPDA